MAAPGDDVFSDDITVPATDGYPLAATLYLPRGAKRHAVLINSATAVPRMRPSYPVDLQRTKASPVSDDVSVDVPTTGPKS